MHKTRNIKHNHTPMLFLLALTQMLFNISAPAYAATDDAPSFQTITDGITVDDLAGSVDSYVTENEATTAGLAVAVMQDGNVLLRKDYGFADADTGRAVGSEDVFEWGSISKLLVWVSAMQLSEQGRLDLSADIRTYLPDGFLTLLEYDEEITFYNLMHHNAGWQEVAAGLLADPYEGEFSLEKALHVTEPPQLYKPGEIVAYSNWGVALAGYIVERVSGQPFADYVHENIFAPLGMQQTALMPYLEDVPWVQQQRGNIAGHFADGSKMPDDSFHVALYPAGSTIGIADDMVKFANALLPAGGEPSPLFGSRATLDEFFAVSMHYSDGSTPRNAHGMWVEQYGVETVGHGGNTNGFSTMLMMHPASRTAVVVLTNQGNEDVYCNGLIERLYGRQDIGGGAPASDGLPGFYSSARTIQRGGGKLYSLLMTIPLTGSGDNMTVPVFGATFTPDAGNWTRIEGNMPYPVGDYIYSDYASDPARMSMSVMDFVRIPTAEGIFSYATVLFFALALLYSVVCLVASLVGIMKNRKNKKPLTPLLAVHRGMSLAQLVVLFNVIFTFSTLMSYTLSTAANVIRCGISVLFIVLAAGYWALLVRQKLAVRRGGNAPSTAKVSSVYYLTGMCAVFTSVFIIYWQLCLMP